MHNLFGEATSVAARRKAASKSGARVHGQAQVQIPWWYEQPLDTQAVEAEATKIFEAMPEAKVDGVDRVAFNAAVATATTQAREIVVRRVVSDKLKEWYRGVAAWSPEARERAIESAKRMKEQGYLQ